MTRSDYLFLVSRLEELQAQKRELLVEMELHHQTQDPESFDRWWMEEGNFERCRKLSEEVERIAMEIDTATVTEDTAPRRMRIRGGERNTDINPGV